MKKILLFSLMAFIFCTPGCQTNKKTQKEKSSESVTEQARIPDAYKRKSQRELRKEERMRLKQSGIFYNR